MFGCVAAVAAASVASAEPPNSHEVQAGGMRAYADPRTGALRGTPPPGTVPPPAAAFSRSSSGLVETRGRGGGVMVDLQGRFKSPLVATVGPDGTVHIGHDPSPE